MPHLTHHWSTKHDVAAMLPNEETAKDLREYLREAHKESPVVSMYKDGFDLAQFRALMKDLLTFVMEKRPDFAPTAMANYLLSKKMPEHEVPVHFHDTEEEARKRNPLPRYATAERLLRGVIAGTHLSKDKFVKQMACRPDVYSQMVALAFKDQFLVDMCTQLNDPQNLTPDEYRKEKLDRYLTPLVKACLHFRPRFLVPFVLEHLIAIAVAGPRECTLQLILDILSDDHETSHRNQFVYRIVSFHDLPQMILELATEDFQDERRFINFCEHEIRKESIQFAALTRAAPRPSQTADKGVYTIELAAKPAVLETVNLLGGMHTMFCKDILAEEYNILLKISVPGQAATFQAGDETYSCIDGVVVLADELLRIGDLNASQMSSVKIKEVVGNGTYPLTLTLKSRVPKWDLIFQWMAEHNCASEQEWANFELLEQPYREAFETVTRAAVETLQLDLCQQDVYARLLQRMDSDPTRLTRAQQDNPSLVDGTSLRDTLQHNVRTYLHPGLGVVLSVPVDMDTAATTPSNGRRAGMVGDLNSSFSTNLSALASMTPYLVRHGVSVPMCATARCASIDHTQLLAHARTRAHDRTQSTSAYRDAKM